MCKHMVDKFCRKDAKKGSFSNQMEFRKRSIITMKILKGFKYRLRPNRKHRTFFSQFSGCARYVYNQGLERRQQVYEKEKKTLRYFDQNKELTTWRKELDWLEACHIVV